MIGTDCQGSTTNTQQHNRSCSADGHSAPRTRGCGISIVRNEDMNDIDCTDDTIDDAHEEIHTSIVHFIS